MTLAKGIEISNAKGCAWRALYLAILTIDGDPAAWQRPVTRRQIAHVGIDPTATRPSIFGAIGRFSFRAPIPFMTWKPRQWYIRQRWQHFIKSLDGRFQ